MRVMRNPYKMIRRKHQTDKQTNRNKRRRKTLQCTDTKDPGIASPWRLQLTVTPIVCESSVWNMLHITFMTHTFDVVPRFLEHFCNSTYYLSYKKDVKLWGGFKWLTKISHHVSCGHSNKPSEAVMSQEDIL